MTHLGPVKGYLASTYFIKNQSIGVPWGTLHDLFRNFEFVTSGPFARPLTANFSKKKNWSITHWLWEILAHK